MCYWDNGSSFKWQRRLKGSTSTPSLSTEREKERNKRRERRKKRLIIVAWPKRRVTWQTTDPLTVAEMANLMERNKE
jgi:hypothetical protein